MGSKKYIGLLLRRVVPFLQEMFVVGDGIFQQDLVPCHTVKKYKNFLTDNKMNVLPLPGNSPDLNLIENL